MPTKQEDLDQLFDSITIHQHQRATIIMDQMDQRDKQFLRFIVVLVCGFCTAGLLITIFEWVELMIK